MLTVVKSLNNNIILAKNAQGEELVLFGTGIGYNRKKGDSLEVNAASKVFKSGDNYLLSELLEDISPELLSLTKEVIELGEKSLNAKLNSSILFSLADHLRFSIKREQEGIPIENPLQWEIPHLYFQEYQIGKQALSLINTKLGILLPDVEASFIALHFVNAQGEQGQLMGDTVQIAQVTQKIVKIIQSLFNVTLDKTAFVYSRFITHIRYFIVRQKTGNAAKIEADNTLKEIVYDRYLKSYACALLIKEALKREYGFEATEDELVYLIIHIEGLIKANKALKKETTSN